MQIIYRAYDGTEFDEKIDCIAYETDHKWFPNGVNFYTEDLVPMAYGTAEQFNDCMMHCEYMELTEEVDEIDWQDFGEIWDTVTAGLYRGIGFYKWGMDEAQFGEVDPYGWIKIEDPRKEN